MVTSVASRHCSAFVSPMHGRDTSSIWEKGTGTRAWSFWILRSYLQRICFTTGFRIFFQTRRLSSNMEVPKAFACPVPTLHLGSPRSQISSLTQPSVDGTTIMSQQKKLLDLHRVILCDEEVVHIYGKGTNLKNGKRKRRGKCMICGVNTRHYCAGCEPDCKRKKAWCCSDDKKRKCFTEHIKNLNPLLVGPST